MLPKPFFSRFALISPDLIDSPHHFFVPSSYPLDPRLPLPPPPHARTAPSDTHLSDPSDPQTVRRPSYPGNPSVSSAPPARTSSAHRYSSVSEAGYRSFAQWDNSTLLSALVHPCHH